MLAVDELSVSYGATRAVRDASITVQEGEIVALLGSNGAGKSSLLKALAGLINPKGGTVRFRGKDVTGMAPEQMVRLGLSLTPEGRHVFADLTVEENLRLGAATRRDRAAVKQDSEAMAEMFPALAQRWRMAAGNLSGGEQQMLALARSLISMPRLLMIDEPSLGLAPAIVDQIFELFGKLNSDGLTILLIEQDAHRALSVSHRAYVMKSGEIAYEGESAALAESPDLVNAYLGSGVDAGPVA